MPGPNGFDDVKKLSVTAGDIMKLEAGQVPISSPMGYYFFLAPNALQGLSQGVAGLPRYYTREGDYFLRESIFMEDMWAGGVARGVTKIVNQSWLVEDKNDSQRNTRQAQDLLNNAEGGDGWDSFLSKLLLDFLLTDNGCHFEIVRAGNKPGGRVLGLFHLDSCRVRRSGNTQYPAVYMDLEGQYHPLEWWQVVSFSDMEHTDSRLFGVGRCAARRCIATITLLAGITGHASERVLGAGNTVIHLITGVGPETLKAALADSEQANLQKGRFYYKGALLIPMIDPTANPNVQTIQLSGLPENFNANDLRTDGYHKYANNLGIPITDIIPLSGQGLGTGTQSRIIDERAEGIGLAAFVKKVARALNNQRYAILPRATQFSWDEHDIRDDKAKADAANTRATERATRVKAGEITAAQALQLAVDAGDAPENFLPQGDGTTGGELTDTENPEEVQDQSLISEQPPETQPAPEQGQNPAPTNPGNSPSPSGPQPAAPVVASQPGSGVPATKSRLTADELFDQEIAHARILSREARKQEKGYNPDQVRDERGRFGSGSGGSTTAHEIPASHAPPVVGDRTPAEWKADTSWQDRFPPEIADRAVQSYAENLPRAAELDTTLSGLAQANNGEMTGMEYHVKTPPSIADKMERWMAEDGSTPDQALAGMKDNVRYTMLFPQEDFVSGTQAALDGLRDKGYTGDDHCFRNTFKEGSAYKGLNTNWKDPEGRVFELQFHTPESFSTKMLNHVDYEQARRVGTSSEDVYRLNAQMSGRAADVYHDDYATAFDPSDWFSSYGG